MSRRPWERLRDQVVYEEPLCRLGLHCCTGWSETADHIEPVSTRPDLRMERTNLRGSCHACNDTRRALPELYLARPRWWAA